MPRPRTKSSKTTTFHPHLTDYGVLTLGVVVCLLGFLLSWPFIPWQQFWVIAFALFYITWGCWHHYKTDRHLPVAVMAEYVGVAVLIAATLFFAISY